MLTNGSALAENNELDRIAMFHDREAEKRKHRVWLVPFDEITLGAESRYLVKGLIPRVGLSVIWGPPKCGKSFWVFDLAMHVALGCSIAGEECSRARWFIALSRVKPEYEPALRPSGNHFRLKPMSPCRSTCSR